MGLLVDGEWKDQWYDTESTGGRFEREAAQLRNWVTPDGAPGPSGKGSFAAEPGRYRLYVAKACPWSHRAMIFRVLKGLEEMIPMSVTHWHMGKHGWTFEDGEGVVPDPVLGADYMHQLYTANKADYSGRVTVPVLWDTKQCRIVSNESSDIIRMFNSAFDGIGAKAGDYYPEPLRDEIDAINERVYATVNNGVYRAGFATTQEAYEEAVAPLFETLDWLDDRLATRRYLAGDALTEADWRLWVTLVRFDAVYYNHFKCNVRRIVDYPHLWAYTRDLFQHPGIAATVDMDHIKRHYYGSHETINPTGVVPVGPEIDFDAPVMRERRAA